MSDISRDKPLYRIVTASKKEEIFSWKLEMKLLTSKKFSTQFNFSSFENSKIRKSQFHAWVTRLIDLSYIIRMNLLLAYF